MSKNEFQEMLMNILEDTCHVEDTCHKGLDEGYKRTAAQRTRAAMAKRHGDEAVKAFRNGRRTLRQPMDLDDVGDRLARFEVVLDALLEGLLHMQAQTRAHDGFT